MFRVTLDDSAGFDEFREPARGLLAADVPPDRIVWDLGGAADLFGGGAPAVAPATVSVPAAFVELARDACCHRDPERFALLYRLLWRLTHDERALLAVASDPLVHRLRQMQKAVRRDAHKMTAFVRFRRVMGEAGEHFVAWFEPEHHILRRVPPFFVDRFASMRWSILTPGGSLHWDGTSLSFGPAISKEHAPRFDDLEQWWSTYYRSTFNPARATLDAMRAEMPKK